MKINTRKVRYTKAQATKLAQAVTNFAQSGGTLQAMADKVVEHVSGKAKTIPHKDVAAVKIEARRHLTAMLLSAGTMTKEVKAIMMPIKGKAMAKRFNAKEGDLILSTQNSVMSAVSVSIAGRKGVAPAKKLSSGRKAFVMQVEAIERLTKDLDKKAKTIKTEKERDAYYAACAKLLAKVSIKAPAVKAAKKAA